MLSKDELHTILDDTHWEVKEFINRSDGVYVAILEKRQ